MFLYYNIRQNGVAKESKENATVKRSSNDAANEDEGTIKRNDKARPLPKVFYTLIN